MSSMVFNVCSKRKKETRRIPWTPRKRKTYPFNPIFSFHSLKRISERFSELSYSKEIVEICWEYISYNQTTRWIKPSMIRYLLEDIQRHIFNIWVSEEREWFLLKGKKIWYVIGKWQEIITVHPHEWFSYISKYKYRPLAKKHIPKLFMPNELTEECFRRKW